MTDAPGPTASESTPPRQSRDSDRHGRPGEAATSCATARKLGALFAVTWLVVAALAVPVGLTAAPGNQAVTSGAVVYETGSGLTVTDGEISDSAGWGIILEQGTLTADNNTFSNTAAGDLQWPDD